MKMLALVHISSRYHVGKVLEEVRQVFEPTVAPSDFDVRSSCRSPSAASRAWSRTAPASRTPRQPRRPEPA